MCAWPHRSGTEPRVDNACARARLRNPFDPARTSAVGAGSSGCSRTGITATWAPHRSMLRWPTRWRPRASARAGEDGDDAIDERVCLARVAANRDGGGDDAARGGARGSSAAASGLARGPRWAAEGDAGRCAGRSSRGSPRARPPRHSSCGRVGRRRRRGTRRARADRPRAPRRRRRVRRDGSRGRRAEVRPVEGVVRGVNVGCRTTATVADEARAGSGRRRPWRTSASPARVFLGEAGTLALLVPVEAGEVAHGAPRTRAPPRSDVHARRVIL